MAQKTLHIGFSMLRVSWELRVMSSPCQAPVSVQCSQQRSTSDMYGVFWCREGSLVPIVLSHEAAGSGGGVEGFDVGPLAGGRLGLAPACFGDTLPP